MSSKVSIKNKILRLRKDILTVKANKKRDVEQLKRALSQSSDKKRKLRYKERINSTKERYASKIESIRDKIRYQREALKRAK